MAEHFPKSTETATGWCVKCNRPTDPKHPAPPIERETAGKGPSRGKTDPPQGDLF